METYNPKFHADKTITYWCDKNGGFWIHRKHPALIPAYVVTRWNIYNRNRYSDVMGALGYKREFNGRFQEWVKK